MSALPVTFNVRKVIHWSLAIQVGLAVLLMGGDLWRALPHLGGSDRPAFDTPVNPGDQTRRYRPRDMPLAPEKQGNPERRFTRTGDMPERLVFTRDGTEVTLTGAIEPGDADRFFDFLTAETAASDTAIETLRLNSPGGSVAEALAIGRRARAEGFSTQLQAGDICLSACPYVLASGVTRRVHDDAQVGVHQHYFGENTFLPAFMAVADVQRGQGEVMTYLNDMGVDPLVMQHALRTPPNEIYVLLPQQLRDYALVTPPTQ